MKSWILLLLCGLVLVQLPQLLSIELFGPDVVFRNKCMTHHLCKCGSHSYNHMKHCYGKYGEKSKKVIEEGWNHSGVGGGKRVRGEDFSSYKDFLCILSEEDLGKAFTHSRKQFQLKFNEWESHDLSEVQKIEEYEHCIHHVLKHCAEHPGGCLHAPH